MRTISFFPVLMMLSLTTACFEEPTQEDLNESLGAAERRVFAEYGCRCARSADEAKKKVNEIIKALLKEYDVPGGVEYTGPTCNTYDIEIIAGEPDPWDSEFYICHVVLEDGREISYHPLVNWGSRPEPWPQHPWSDD